MLAINLGQLIEQILFATFAALTSIVAAIIGPTYDTLLVPEMKVAALYPSLFASHPGPSNFLAPAAQFSTFLLVNVVDPAVTLVVLGVAILYFARVAVNRWASQFDGLLPRLILAVVAANFTVPIAGGLLAVAGALFPVIAGWDGGAWQHWVNLAGAGEIRYSFDNGALAFILSLAEFFLVLALVLAIGVRDALLAVLVVLLPIFTLLWPLRPLSTLARRAWLLFAELAFLPCVVVVPLELAVGSPSPVLLVGYLSVAIGSPYLLSVAGSHLTAFGFASGGTTLQAGANRGVASAPGAATSFVSPISNSMSSAGPAGRAVAGSVQAAAHASGPVAVPLAAAQMVGHGALHLVRHVRGASDASGPPNRWPPIRGRGSG